MRQGTSGFVSVRLKEAREARELTATSLADLIGVSRQAVSQYENGTQTPSPYVMRRLIEVLRFPYHFFLGLPTPDEKDLIFFRSVESATKASRLRAQRRYGWVRSVVRYLRESVHLPKAHFPACPFRDDPRSILERDIERAAEGARRFWSLKDYSISNLVWLVENHGGIVTRFELGSDKPDAFSQWNREDATPYIVLGSDKGSAVRSRYDLAHELGHILLHRSVRKDAFVDKAVFRLIEQQAHRFAGCFLLPGSTFGAEFGRMPTLEYLTSLKAKWKVSILFMIMRCAELDIISEHQKGRLFAGISARGWRQKEPLDDMIEFEEPCLLKRSLELLIERRIVSSTDISFRLGLDDADVEELTGLVRGYLRKHQGGPAAPFHLMEPNERSEHQPSEDQAGLPDVLPFPKAE